MLESLRCKVGSLFHMRLELMCDCLKLGEFVVQKAGSLLVRPATGGVLQGAAEAAGNPWGVSFLPLGAVFRSWDLDAAALRRKLGA